MKNKSNFSNGLTGKSNLPVKPIRKEMVFSFRDFDHTQGQTFLEWDTEQLAHIMLERIKEYSRFTRNEAEQNQSLKVYGIFPPNSDFKHPVYITEDAEWATLKIQGKRRIAGHIVGNVFYIVFLDKEHRFWITEKKHT